MRSHVLVVNSRCITNIRNTRVMKHTWKTRKWIAGCAHAIHCVHGLLIITNAYNADLTGLPEEIELCMVDFVAFLCICIARTGVWPVFVTFLLGMCKLQWIFHSPFHDWPSWWIRSKGANDVRHRTEYYDTITFACVAHFAMLHSHMLTLNLPMPRCRRRVGDLSGPSKTGNS